MAEIFSKTNLFCVERESIFPFLFPKTNSNFHESPSSLPLRLQSNDFRRNKLVLHNHSTVISPSTNTQFQSKIGKAQRWWEKGLAGNMREIRSAQELVDFLRSAGDTLVILNFFSPSCGGCKALHPKICQLAEMNPDVQFLDINYEEHKSMCYSLNVHVLPLFRFYRGDRGRVSSFSCTNATIKKFKDALAKYSPESSSVGPAKGLEEKELIALSANKDLDFTYTPDPTLPDSPEPVPATMPHQQHFTESEPSLSSSNKPLITSER